MEASRKPHNAINNQADVARVTRVFECPAAACLRFIVEYGSDVPETRHNQGLSSEIRDQLEALGRPIVAQVCDRHGGEWYGRPA